MLIATSICSAILLVVSTISAAVSRFGPVLVGGLTTVILLAWSDLEYYPTPVLHQAVAIICVGVVCFVRSAAIKTFAMLAFVATLAVYSFAQWQSRSYFASYQEQRNAAPFVAMDQRLPVNRNPLTHGPLSDESSERLINLEQQVERINLFSKEDTLRWLHEETLQQFLDAPGFGELRARFIPIGRTRLSVFSDPPKSEAWQKPPSSYVHENPTILIPQPSHSTDQSAQTRNEASQDVSNKAEFHLLHHESLLDFLNPAGYGYFKSRQQVAGFESHRFSRLPDPPTHFQLQTLDLVGLVIHPQPVAYVSDNLPRMEELRKAPTRELNEFESAGLEEIKKGDDLYARESDSKLRLFGAIRATKQCTECHGCQRGDLLGAFSYVLKRSTP